MEELLKAQINSQNMVIGQLSTEQTKLEDQQANIEKSIENIISQPGCAKSCENTISKEELEASLQAIFKVAEEKLLLVKSSLQELQLKLEGQETGPKEFSKANLKIPPNFERISGRHFYIENNIKKNWTDAAETCRNMGGYLAAIENETEFEIINRKLLKNTEYWLGLNDKEKEGEFVSLASGKNDRFLLWDAKQNNQNINCVQLLDEKMSVKYCFHRDLFICQSDNEV